VVEVADGSTGKNLRDIARSWANGVSEETIEVFPENAKAFEIFKRLQTQWERSMMNGRRERLNYAPLEAVFALCGVPKDEHESLFDKLQLMEIAVINEDRKRIK
jgi:hypothetical protein